LGRPVGKHVDNRELDALVPTSCESGQEVHGLDPDAVRQAERHVRSCKDCSRKVASYRQLMNRLTDGVAPEGAQPGAECPPISNADWREVAAGLWPELKASQLILHAALCDHCGPLLRAATSVNNEPVRLRRKPQSNPASKRLLPLWAIMRWMVPVFALMGIVLVLILTPAPLSGPAYAQLAVRIHEQQARGNLALDVRSDSQQTLNEWFKKNLQFSLALPASPAAPGEHRPYRIEGARLERVRGKTAAFVAYQMQTGPVSLMVVPDSVAVASGGVEANFKKLSFHYAMIGGYKVVTWSTHALTYALVSEEGTSTQRSCMVCHSPMKDRDLSRTPTPLHTEQNTGELVLQHLPFPFVYLRPDIYSSDRQSTGGQQITQ
jgi:anti-sigma factor RsiW